MGYSRDAYYKAVKRQKSNTNDNQIVLDIVHREKALLKNCGSKKIYHILKPEITKAGIKMGRDKLHKLLKDNNLLVKRKKYKKPKTASKHHFYKHKNLIKKLEINRVNQVWVSDITYILVNGNCPKTLTNVMGNYLPLITDLFSRRIVGYSFSKGMSVLETTQPALNMALKTKSKKQKTILHSDRGFQYCSPCFTKQFKKKKLTASMSKAGDPYENAVAERVNGILKYEFDLKDYFLKFNIAKKEIQKAVHLYNHKRPHWSISLNTPDQFFFAKIA